MRIDVESIRRRHPLAELVASYGIELRRVGSALVGRCPFHRDGGRPNLHVYRSGRWICYRCDQRGDVIGFVQQIEHLSFREAAARLNGGLAQPSRAARHRRVLRHLPAAPRASNTCWGPDEYRVLAAAADLYANQLLSHGPALGYMTGRGFARELLERYRVGYAAGGELISYLRWRHLPLGAAMRTGLITSDGREVLAGRVTFPELRQGRPVWMIGRVLGEPDGSPTTSDAKYLGLPGAKPLLGWDAIRDTQAVCLVEGPTDLLALRLWGIPGLALAGSAVRDDTLALLGRFAHLYLALDDNTVGQQGTGRLVARLGARATRVQLPAGVKDVAELLTIPRGDQLFRSAISNATSTNTT
jgi:DNA primase